MEQTTSLQTLVCRELTKSYLRGRPILQNLNITLRPGRVVGLLGPNGCGKSTLLKLICGILVPDSGEITVCGEPQSEATNRFISYLPERTYFDGHMVVTELMDYFADFYDDFDRTRAEDMLRDLGVDMTARLRTLSKGTKEKVQLVLVMARRARLYLLDEPIGGVDPAARDYILNTIIGQYDKNATVLITTHLIHDVESALDEFAFMANGGRILLAGNAEQTRAERGKSLDDLFREVFACLPN